MALSVWPLGLNASQRVNTSLQHLFYTDKSGGSESITSAGNLNC